MLTHGLSNKSQLDGDPPLPEALWTGYGPQQASRLISDRTNGQINVIQFIWKDAFQVDLPFPTHVSYNQAQRHVKNAGSLLAKNLLTLLGEDYEAPIQFIGHSLGTAVNAYAARDFLATATMVKKAQFTALDRPDEIYWPDAIPGCLLLFPPTCRNYNKDFFGAMFHELQNDPGRGIELIIDNYYSKDGPGFGVGNKTYGSNVYNHDDLVKPHKIDDLLISEGFPNNHSGVHQWYRWTISPHDPVGSTGNEVCSGETFTGGAFPYHFDDFTASLNPCSMGWSWSIVNPHRIISFPPTKNLAVKTAYELIVVTDYHDHGCVASVGTGELAGIYIVVCTEASSPFGVAEVIIPENAEWLTFDYQFSASGDGDYAVVFMDDTPIWTLAQSSAISSDWSSSGHIPIGGFAGSRRLTIALYGVNEANAQFSLRNIQVTATSVIAPDLETKIQELYIGILGRAADRPGLDYWYDQITIGTFTPENTRAAFTDPAQAEYTEIYGGLDNTQLVTATYENFLERAPETAGLLYWVDELDNGRVNPDQMINAIINAVRDPNATGEEYARDLAVLENKIVAAEYFTEQTKDHFFDAAYREMAKAAVADVTDDPETLIQSKAMTDEYVGN